MDERQQSTAPVIVSVPVTKASVGESYIYQVVTEGEPKPTYQLSAAPAGMTIGGSSGLINWVPNIVGSFDVVQI
jgi:hypothetical protein